MYGLTSKHFLYYPLTRKIVDWAVRALTDPLKLPNPAEASDLRSMKKRLRAGDVLLVCGNARISSVVKVLTISPWSHVVMYVGDARHLLTVEERTEWTRRFGEASLRHLVLDADPVRKVHLKPLDDYAGLMVRHCRAAAITSEDMQRVLSNALSQLGRQYDVKHIVRLLFFFAFPWELLPESWRRFATDFTLSEDDRICSRVLAEAFHSVGYPIRPLRMIQHRGSFHRKALGVAFGMRSRSKSALKLLLGGRLSSAVSRLSDKRYAEIHLTAARHITPADYDLSRFFVILKDDDDLRIPYRQAKILCPLPDT